MRTNAQLEASRRNGALSSGPKTEAGRRRSATNSRSHGIFARDLILPGENPEEFTELYNCHRDRLNPETAEENELVHELAIARWRLRRVWKLETHACSAELTSAEVVEKQLQNYGKISRYESRLQRTYDKVEARILDLQAARREAEHAERRRLEEEAILEHQLIMQQQKYQRAQQNQPKTMTAGAAGASTSTANAIWQNEPDTHINETYTNQTHIEETRIDIEETRIDDTHIDRTRTAHNIGQTPVLSRTRQNPTPPAPNQESRQNENRQNEPELTPPTRAQMLREIRQADPRILLQAMRDVLPAEAMETLFNNTKEAA